MDYPDYYKTLKVRLAPYERVTDWQEANRRVAEWRDRWRLPPEIILVNGCFDGLHPGHLLKIADAARRGYFLIVSVDTDAEVQRLKGCAPLRPWADRAAVVASLRLVDLVTMHGEGVGSLTDLVRLLKPTIWHRREDAPEGDVDGVRVVRAGRNGEWSSSGLRERSGTAQG